MKIIEDDKDDDVHSCGYYHCDYERSSSESDYYDGYDNNVGWLIEMVGHHRRKLHWGHFQIVETS